MHTAQGGRPWRRAAAETSRRRDGESRLRIVKGLGQARGAPFGPRREARGPAQRLGAPRPTLNTDIPAVCAQSPPFFRSCRHQSHRRRCSSCCRDCCRLPSRVERKLRARTPLPPSPHLPATSKHRHNHYPHYHRQLPPLPSTIQVVHRQS